MDNTLPMSPGSTNDGGMPSPLGITTGGFGDTMFGKPIVLPPVEREKKYGLECICPEARSFDKTVDGIFFRAGHWRPGGEYIQKLVVRNVSKTVRKFKYKLPSTRFFSLAYPEVITLSPGTFKDIDVIFRPVEYEPYDDTIYIKMQEGPGGGGFHVPVRATIDKLIASVPYGIDLGFCPTNQVTYQIFRLSNDGEVDAPFRWEAPVPFVLEPMEGIVEVGKFVNIKVSIYPTDASVFVAQATCFIGEGVHAIIPYPVISTKLSAVGKYAYIILSELDISFGEVLVGTPPDSIKKEIFLRNNSVVDAEYELIRHDSDRDEVFEIYPKSGVIPAMSEIEVSIKYNSLAMGCFSLDRYTYKTPGNCRTTLTCRGMSMPPKVTCFKDVPGGPLTYFSGSPGDSINFRDTELGKIETRIIFLKNASHRDSNFFVVADEEGTFKFHPRQGVIPAEYGFFPIKIWFIPKKPINYYRRIFILVANAPPLFFDIMGSGFIRAKGDIKEQRPFPLRHAHVQAFRNRQVLGMGKLSPDELDQLYLQLEQGDTNLMLQREIFALVGKGGTAAISVTNIKAPLTRSGETTRTAIAPAHEFFIDDNDQTAKEVTLDKYILDFGYTNYGSRSEVQHVSITNHTNGKISVIWALPQVHGSTMSMLDQEDGSLANNAIDNPAMQPSFDVEPANADINPGKSQTFSIIFKPYQSNRNYVSELEAYVYFKNQRTFRLVNDTTMSPPWCLVVTALGHTFATGQLSAKAKLCGSNIKNGKLVFPSTMEGAQQFQTIILKNSSNLPFTFSFNLGWDNNTNLSGNSSEFTVKPLAGEVAAESFILVNIRFSPQGRKKYTQLLKCVVNGELSARLLLEGTGSSPSLICLSTDTFAGIPLDQIGLKEAQREPITKGSLGIFYLSPTCVGLSSSRKLTFLNTSRIPLRYRITLPPESNGILSISQNVGLVRGNEDLVITVYFAPQKAIKYNFRIKLKTYPIGGPCGRIIDARQIGMVDQPEVLQAVSIDVIAPGEIGALVFNPSRLSIPVRLVDTTESRELFIENVSDCDIYYKLFYKIEFLPDTGSVDQPRINSQYIPLLSSKNTTETVLFDDGTNVDHCLFCTFPEGNINARSQLRNSFTFHPPIAGLFEMFLYAKVQVIDGKNEPKMLQNEEAALLRISQENREEVFFEAVRAESTNQDRVSSLSNFPLTAAITSRSAYPTIIFEDIRVDGYDCQVNLVDALWHNFNLSKLNLSLSLPLTPEEAKLFLNSSPDSSKFDRYSFNFTPGVIGSPLQKVYIKIRNCGYLTSSFHMHLPNEKQLDLEAWCDEDDPTPELNQIICIIEELQCFSIEPKNAVLQPGESCIVTCTYSHTSLKYDGLHKIPVYFVVDQGKQFYIDLCGRTIPLPPNPMTSNKKSKTALTKGTPAFTLPTQDSLLIVNQNLDGILSLQPVPIGIFQNDAPRQRTELINVSSNDVFYEIDHVSIDRFIESQNNVPILQLTNPRGLIPAFSSIYLDWFFFPLEIDTYNIPIAISYHAANRPATMSQNEMNIYATKSIASTESASKGGGIFVQSETYRLNFTLQVKGYDPRIEKPRPYGADFKGGIPAISQQFRIPGQIGFFSNDIINFGIVPQYCTSHRLVMLKNLLDAEIDFNFNDATSYLLSLGLISISPSAGKIEKGRHVMVNVTLNAKNTCAFSFNNRIKVTVRECIPIVKRRDATANASLASGDDNTNDVTSKKDHESVILRTTSTTEARMKTVALPIGKTASLPSTLSADGKLLLSKTTAAQGDDVALSFYPGSIASDTFSVTSNSQGPSATRNNGTSGTLNQDLRGNTRSQSPTRSTSAPGSVGSRSRGSSRDRSGANHKELFGPPQCLVLRIEGDIFPIETVVNIIEKGPLNGLVGSYIIPPNPNSHYIPTSTAIALELTRAASNHSSAAPENTNKINIPVDYERHSEVRQIADSIIVDLFKTLVGNNKDIAETMKSSTSATSTVLSLSDSGLNLNTPPIGKPLCGVYYEEIVPELPLIQLCIRELKHAGFINQRSECTDMDTVGSVGIVKTAGHYNEPVVPNIPANWMLADAIYADTYAFYLTFDMLSNAFNVLTIDETIQAVLINAAKNMMSASSNNDQILLCKLFEKMDSKTQQEIRFAVSRYTMNRLKAEKKSRKSSSKIISDDLQDIITTEIITEEVKMEQAIENINEEETEAVYETKETDNNTPKVEDKINEEKINEIVTNTNNIIKKKFSKEAKELFKKEKLRESAKIALQGEEFISCVDEILRNTFFNLIEEASFSEFAIDAEPIKFVIKK